MLLLVLLALPAAVHAQFAYSTENGQITITGYTGPGGALDIPPTIIGLPVVALGYQAFLNNTNLISVTIPNSVTAIEMMAFLGCNGLVTVTVPNSVSTLGDLAFSGCTSLKSIEVDGLNTAFSSLHGVLFSKDRTVLLRCPEGKTGSFTLPNTVTTVGNEAFSNCIALTAVTMLDGVTTIGKEAFSGCTGLVTVTIPSSVRTLGETVFQRCTRLKSIEVDGLNTAFSSLDGVLFSKDRTVLLRCPGGKTGSYTLPNTVTTVGEEAFTYCSALTGVTIPDSVTSLGSYAFYDCTALTAVTIPDSVTSLGGSAFEGCTGLKNVTIPNGLTAIWEYTFDGCTGLTSVTIPDSITELGVGSFYRCTSLTRVTIPASVTTLGELAFSGCTSLTSVYFQGNAPRVMEVRRALFSPGVTIYYLPGTAGWGPIYNFQPTALWSHPLIQSNDSAFGASAGGFGFLISWAPNASVTVEAAPNLGSSVWTPISTNILTNGSSQFTDPEWTNHPSRLYRLVSR